MAEKEVGIPREHTIRRVLLDAGDEDIRLAHDVTIALMDEAVLIRPPHCGTKGMDDDHGYPVMFEIYNNVPRLIVWADINQEDPTHIIDLSGSKTYQRKP